MVDVPSRMDDPEASASFGTDGEGASADKCGRMDVEVESVAAAAPFHLKWKVKLPSGEEPTKKLVLGPKAPKSRCWTSSVEKAASLL
jgi:hypothetical protein